MKSNRQTWADFFLISHRVKYDTRTYTIHVRIAHNGRDKRRERVVSRISAFRGKFRGNLERPYL